jgi:putative selenium metabolism hydrolase
MTMQTGMQALAWARGHEAEIVGFLRDMIAIPAESGREAARCERCRAEYEQLGFDDVHFDRLGNVVARVGHGPFTILMDGHIDCVGVGDRAAWTVDPFRGKLEDGEIWGRGAVDELPAIAAMAWGAKLAQERGLLEGVSLVLVASVMEECADGYPLQHLIEVEGVRPDVVVLGEPTDMAVFRGHRGRMGIEIRTRGVSAHGAHCDRGVNAVTKAARIVLDVDDLHRRLPTDDFLGKGTVTVSFIECTTPSLNAVPDSARIVLDRRLTAGESPEGALAEVRALPSLGDAEVGLLTYRGRSWRGFEVVQEEAYPTWVLPEEHPLVEGAAAAIEAVVGARPAISRWTFSTNGVATMGRLGIPTVGFAPGREELAHSTEEHVKVADLVAATAAYALMPEALATRFKK